jgi:hypothetical protein
MIDSNLLLYIFLLGGERVTFLEDLFEKYGGAISISSWSLSVTTCLFSSSFQ